MRLTVIFAAVMLTFTGCADTHKLVRSSPAGGPLNSSDTVFIAIPQNGSYGSEVYSNSGNMTAQTIYAAFAKKTHSVSLARSQQSFANALQSARAENSKYLAFSTILHWEDRATEWSGKRDKVEVKLEVVEVPTGNVVQSAVISGRSKWATFGGDHPQDLLPVPIEEFVSSLY